MKRTAIILTLLFSVSILTGCLGGDSSTENDAAVTDLQAQIDNLTVLNQQHEGDINSLKDQLATPHIPKIMHNATYDAGWLRWAGVEVQGTIIDTMIAAPLLDENRFSYSLNNLAKDLSLIHI